MSRQCNEHRFRRSYGEPLDEVAAPFVSQRQVDERDIGRALGHGSQAPRDRVRLSLHAVPAVTIKLDRDQQHEAGVVIDDHHAGHLASAASRKVDPVITRGALTGRVGLLLLLLGCAALRFLGQRW